MISRGTLKTRNKLLYRHLLTLMTSAYDRASNADNRCRVKYWARKGVIHFSLDRENASGMREKLNCSHLSSLPYIIRETGKIDDDDKLQLILWLLDSNAMIRCFHQIISNTSNDHVLFQTVNSYCRFLLSYNLCIIFFVLTTINIWQWFDVKLWILS